MRGKKGDLKYLVKSLLLPLIGFLAVMAVLFMTCSRSDAADEKFLLEKCSATLALADTAGDITGPGKYFFDAPDACEPIELKKFPEFAETKTEVELEIMERIPRAWKATHWGEPDIFSHKLIAKKDCVVMYYFTIDPVSGFKKGDIIKKKDFETHLGEYVYAALEKDGKTYDYTYLDYVQSYKDYGGRIVAFPEPDGFCKEDGHDLSPQECQAKKDNLGFKPQGQYAIAIVSPKAKINFLGAPNSISYVLISDSSTIRGLCNVR